MDQRDLQEFALALSRLLRGTLDEKLEWIFTLYDQKGDGVITFDEMHGIVRALYNNMGMMVDPPPDRFAVRQHARDMFQVRRRRFRQSVSRRLRNFLLTFRNSTSKAKDS